MSPRMDVDLESDFHIPFHAPQLAPMHIGGWDYSSFPELVVSLIALYTIDGTSHIPYLCGPKSLCLQPIKSDFGLKPTFLTPCPC